MSALTAKQEAFVAEYLIDLNATQAAIRAGYSEKTASSQGERLLRNVEVQAALSEAQKDRSERTAITADRVLRRWWEIATADPNDVILHRIVCCPKCYGEAQYDKRRPVNVDCTECHGDGVGEVVAADTRKLTGSAKALYAGAKQTAQGIEIKLRDQDKALELVAKHLGMFQEKLKVSLDETLVSLVLKSMHKSDDQ